MAYRTHKQQVEKDLSDLNRRLQRLEDELRDTPDTRSLTRASILDSISDTKAALERKTKELEDIDQGRGRVGAALIPSFHSRPGYGFGRTRKD